MFPFLLLVSMSSLAMGILNTKGKFFVPAMASSCFNLGSIIAGGGLALLFPHYGRPAIEGMAIGTLVGGAMQLLVQLPLVFRFGFRLRPGLALADPGLRRIGRLIVPAIIGLSATQINIFVNTNFASRCAEGSVAWLNYAFRLIQFPIGLFGVALSMAALPVMARQAAEGDRKLMGDTMVSALGMVFVLTLPAAAGLAVLAEPLVALIFEHGRFTMADTAMTAAAVRFYAIGLMAYSAVKITVPVFYALDDTRWPVIASFAAVAANIVIILCTLGRFQHRAIALSTSMTMIMNFFLLTFVLYRKTGGYPVMKLLSTFIKALAASGVMAAGVWYLQQVLDTGRSLSALGLRVALSVAAGVAIYLAMSWLFGIGEVKEVAEALLSKAGFGIKRER
jgi:putative peptidoglycan lipid II flippase